VWRRRGVAVAILAAALIAGYYLWLRDSSLFEVRDVTVSGVTANEEEITSALEQEALGMTTLHVDDDALTRTAQRFPTIASIRADSTILHGLEIHVTERLPVAVARTGGRPVAVSGDGYLLHGVDFDPKALPPINVEGSPTARLDFDGREQAAVLGAAPEELRDEITDATYDPDRGGVVTQLDEGPELRFGDSSDAEAKWAAAAAVLASPDLGAPTYIDVSVPERPVSGGLSG
jgi:cell division protein FtsQ